LGKAELQWNAISASPARYRGEVNAPLAVDSWLQWFWDGSDLSDLSDPSASAFFGTFRGQDRIISWREVN
jgi:MSHA biogenesis protein MshQ